MLHAQALKGLMAVRSRMGIEAEKDRDFSSKERATHVAEADSEIESDTEMPASKKLKKAE